MCIFDSVSVKPKCVWKAVVVLKNCKQIAEKCNWIYVNWKNLLFLENISAFRTLGQKCNISELHPPDFFFIFQMEQLVVFENIAQFENIKSEKCESTSWMQKYFFALRCISFMDVLWNAINTKIIVKT